jgi:putative phosphonate transport system ATP-binding protein
MTQPENERTGENADMPAGGESNAATASNGAATSVPSTAATPAAASNGAVATASETAAPIAAPNGPLPTPVHHEFVEETPVVSVRHLHKRFGDGCPYCEDPANPLERNICPKCGTVHAVRDVSLEVYPGEILGIVGESGSGKSTLMQCLYFDQEPTSGDMRVAAYDGGKANCLELSRQQKRAIRNNIFGMVYQNPYLGLRMDFSAISNIAEKQIAAGNRQVHAMVERGDELLERVRIPLRRKQDPPREFSGGMQQRVQIAKALSNEPPVLFLDEVTTGLDLSVQARVLDLILQLRRDLGVSMIVVSHDLGVIRLLADRTIVMVDGRIIEHGLTDQIMQDPQQAYTQELVYSLL